MAEYRKYLKDWTTERGITSYLGSDKSAFQKDWKEEKRDSVRFGEEVSSMGGEDINRAGEPFKKPKPKRTAAEIVLTNPDLLKQIGAFTNPKRKVPKKTRMKRVKDIIKKKFDDRVYYANRFLDYIDAYGIVDGKVMKIGTVGDYNSLDLFDKPKSIPSNIRFYDDNPTNKPIKKLNDLME